MELYLRTKTGSELSAHYENENFLKKIDLGPFRKIICKETTEVEFQRKI